MLVGTQEDRSRSWRICVEVDGHFWLNMHSGGFSVFIGACGLEDSLSDVNSSPFGFLGHCLCLACSVCITVMGHSESAALCWNSLAEASPAVEMKIRSCTTKEHCLPWWLFFEGNLYFYLSLSSCLRLMVVTFYFHFTVMFLSHCANVTALIIPGRRVIVNRNKCVLKLKPVSLYRFSHDWLMPII